MADSSEEVHVMANSTFVVLEKTDEANRLGCVFSYFVRDFLTIDLSSSCT